VANRASPTVITIRGAISVPTPGAPVLATPIMNAEKMPSAHCQAAKLGRLGGLLDFAVADAGGADLYALGRALH
jgi:hypothetical protein